MTKLLIPFGLAIGVHIIVLLLSGYLIKKEDAELSSSRNLIDVQFGIETKTPQNKSASNIQTQNKAPKIALTQEPASSPLANSSLRVDGVNSGLNFESSIINYQKPIYPRVAQVRGLEGNVRLLIEVSAEGIPVDFTILKKSGHEILDKAALEVIPHWRFQKSSAPYKVEKNIIFQLKDN